MTPIDSTPYSLEWISQHLESSDALKGGLGVNRNIKFTVDDQSYVLHTVENKTELHMMVEVSKKNVGPKVFSAFGEKQWVLMEYIGTPTITPEIAQEHPQEIGAALKRAHEIPLSKDPGAGFAAANHTHFQYIQKNAQLSASLQDMAERANRVFEQGMKELAERNSPLIANVHSDLHARNLFWADRKFLIIDWESCSHGHPYFDLASLSIFLGFNEKQEEALLAGYFSNAPTSEQLEEYRLLKKIRWAYTSIVNNMWAYRLMEKGISEDVPPPNKSFGEYMQSFATSEGMPSLEFFVNVARLSLQEAEKT